MSIGTTLPSSGKRKGGDGCLVLNKSLLSIRSFTRCPQKLKKLLDKFNHYDLSFIRKKDFFHWPGVEYKKHRGSFFDCRKKRHITTGQSERISMTALIAKTGTQAKWARDRHWTKIVRYWQQVGPPLRPSSQDIEFFEDAVQEWIHHYGAPRVLLLGVTPELYRLRWPEGTDFLAVDHSQAMIDAVWPGPKKAVHFTEWLALSLPKSSRDIILCDGGLHLLAYPGEQQQLVHILRDVLSDNGMCIFRLFVPPAQRESSDAVIYDLLEGRISSLNILKLRLDMALLESAAEGVELGRVWRLIHEVAPDLGGLSAKIGWSLEHMLAINLYRDSTARFYFVTVNQVTDLFCGNPGGFKVHRQYIPSYELGERCPTIVVKRSVRDPSS